MYQHDAPASAVLTPVAQKGFPSLALRAAILQGFTRWRWGCYSSEIHSLAQSGWHSSGIYSLARWASIIQATIEVRSKVELRMDVLGRCQRSQMGREVMVRDNGVNIDPFESDDSK